MPRVAVPLTATQVAAAKPKAQRYRLHDGGGLLLEIRPGGTKRWMLRYQHGDSHTMAALVGALGTNEYPAVTLAEARRLADAARAGLSVGKAPTLIREEVVAQAQHAAEEATRSTFRAVANAWHAEKKPGWSVDTARKARLVLDEYLFPYIGEVPMPTLATPQVKPALVALAAKAPALAKKARQYCVQVVEYAIQTGLRDDGRLLSLRGVLPKAEKGHYPAITSDSGVPALLAALSRVDSLRTRTALWLCVYTAVRPGVAVRARWADMNLDRAEWHIPAADMKMAFAHITPLPRQLVGLLRDLRELTRERGAYVFPAMAGRREQLWCKDGSDPSPPSEHMHRDTLSAALRDAGLRGQTVTHGMRAMFRTIARERLGVPDAVLEAQLAHAKRGEVQAAYDRTQHLAERHEAVQKWADYLDSMRKG